MLLLCAVLIGAFRLYQEGFSGVLPYLVVLAVPFTAMAMLLGLALAVPSLTEIGRLAFPINLTFPLVFNALMLLAVTLWTQSSGSLVATHEILRPAKVWAEPAMLGASLAGQVVLLSLATVLVRKQYAR
jgi:hypothetical protein